MDFLSFITERLSRVHPFIWLLAAITFVALVAVFAFGVSIGTATSYAFLVLFWGGHLFMHGSHRGHGSHNSHEEHDRQNASERPANMSIGGTNANDPKEHSSHSGGCH